MFIAFTALIQQYSAVNGYKFTQKENYYRFKTNPKAILYKKSYKFQKEHRIYNFTFHIKKI